MGAASVLDRYAGQWLIANPDQGQALPPRARLVTGGHYRIHADERVEATVTTRDGEGRSESRSLAGRVARASEHTVTLELGEGVREVFEIAGADALRRVASTLGTVEPELRLLLQRRFEAPATKAAMPSILFNTMPKSGSRYITRWLASGLGLNEMKVAVCLFPIDLVIRSEYDRLTAGGFICQQHLPAHDINLRFIANRDPRIVVHVRDPRQATVSWVHHLDNFYAHRDSVPACRLGLEAVMPALPADYFERSFAARLDHQVKEHYPLLVRWTEQWVRAAEERPYGVRILFTTFERFKADPEALIGTVLEHFAIERARFDWSARPAPAADTHFRRGETGEWRDVFSAEQKKFAAGLLTPALRERFAWPD